MTSSTKTKDNHESEIGYEDYLEALESLTQMEVPVWRKPTAKKRWTIAVGLEWVRKTSEELGLTKQLTERN